MILVGGLVTATSALAFARGDVRLLRLGYWSLLAVSLPGYVIMRIGAQWVVSKGWDKVDPAPTWLDIGYTVADAGAVLMLIALVVGGIGMRQLRQGKGQGLLKASLIIAVLILAAAVVAIWAMAGKPD
jgi:hypothetical protein